MPFQLLSQGIPAEKINVAMGYKGKPFSETIANGFFVVDEKWTVTYWNKAAEKILGVPAKDIIGKNLWGEFAARVPSEFYAVDQKVFRQNTPVHFEEYWGEMGAWFDVITYHCDNSLSVSFKSSNQPHAGYIENPGQRLEMLGELYRFVTEITNDCLWEWDLENEQIFWIDGGHKRIFGYEVANALIPQSFWENCIHSDDKKRVLKKLNKTIQEGNDLIWEDEYRFMAADGNYAHVHDRGRIIYNTDKKASRMIGATQDITAKVMLENKLADERLARQIEVTDAILTAQENERAALGRELYDNLNQILAVTRIYIEMAKNNEVKREMYLDKSSAFIMNVIEDINRLSKTLVPPGGSIGLVNSIRNLLNDFIQVKPMIIEFDERGIEEAGMDEKLQLNIFRIVQGQLANILEHSDATETFIRLTTLENKVKLFISDNGKGCDVSDNQKGLGITNIKSRAALYHGTVKIISKPGEGYDLRVVLQYPQIIN